MFPLANQPLPSLFLALANGPSRSFRGVGSDSLSIAGASCPTGHSGILGKPVFATARYRTLLGMAAAWHERSAAGGTYEIHVRAPSLS